MTQGRLTLSQIFGGNTMEPRHEIHRSFILQRANTDNFFFYQNIIWFSQEGFPMTKIQP